MKWLLTLLLSQYMMSATAGLVTQVRGTVNMRDEQIAAPDHAIETGPHGLIDLQLNPGGYLRLRENSTAVFTATAFANIEFTLKHGSALIDVSDDDPPFPIKARAGVLTILVKKSGIYGLDLNAVRVFDGQLELESGTVVHKGFEARVQNGNVQLKKLEKEEVQHPYAPDKLKLFVTADPGKPHDAMAMDSIFAELCKRELTDMKDVKVVSKKDESDYVLTVSVVRKTGDLGIFGEGELKTSEGEVVYSNTRRDPVPNERNRASSGDVLRTGISTASILIGDIRNKTGWR